MYHDFNDYELLYMIRQKDEVALESRKMNCIRQA